MSEESRVRFGPFELDGRSGELRNREHGEDVVDRLPPQPARLLGHLLERRPDLVSREELKALLWPDVEVEFEDSLHSCVRRIRTALGDSATTPRYIETVPRRGYRYIGPPVEAGVGAASPSGEAATSSPAIRRRRVAIALGLGLVVALFIVFRAIAVPAEAPVRVAVMPFTLIDGSVPPGVPRGIAEAIVRRLVESDGAVEVIGPTTTGPYAHQVDALLAAVDVHYVVNARDTSTEAGPRLLIEIIRARDGAHVWARYLDELPGEEVVDRVVEALRATRDQGTVRQ